MKILKVFGIVVGIHVFALMLIFANPGCSSSSKTPPAVTETAAKPETPSSTIVVPTIASAPAEPAPIGFNPDAPAAAAPGNTGVLYPPTRPGTPAASALVAEPVKDVTPMTTYTLKSGDSLWSIANKNKISVSELAAANNLKSNAIVKPGQKLIIPGKSPAPIGSTMSAPAAIPTTTGSTPKITSDAGKTGALHHTVKTGDTLGSIAIKYGVKERDLAIANNITDPKKLQLGKDLVIPGWDSASAKAPKSGKSANSSRPPADSVLQATPSESSVPVIVPQITPSSQTDVPVIRVDETPKKP